MNIKHWMQKNLEEPFCQIELLRAETCRANENKKRNTRLNKINYKRLAHR
ncbi:MAG: hypothetical protein K9L17_03790 [Clostridiales bacterium]|nr:hypothetical protein [Clostridiales bacterium]MCF8021800.1 hypothetical protein [Clostridiales bacterium]